MSNQRRESILRLLGLIILGFIITLSLSVELTYSYLPPEPYLTLKLSSLKLVLRKPLSKVVLYKRAYLIALKRQFSVKIMRQTGETLTYKLITDAISYSQLSKKLRESTGLDVMLLQELIGHSESYPTITELRAFEGKKITLEILGKRFSTTVYSPTGELLLRELVTRGLLTREKLKEIRFYGEDTTPEFLMKALQKQQIYKYLKVSLPRDRVIRDGQLIIIAEYELRLSEDKELIYPETKYVYTYELPWGERKVLREGKSGLVKYVFIDFFRNGKLTKREQLSLKWEKHPEPKVVMIGRGVKFLRETRGPFKGKLYMIAEATAYEPSSNSCGPYSDGYTAIGLKVRKGIVAVDPNIIPLGTKLYVEGYGWAIAGDVGGAIKGKRIDVFFPTYQEAIRWGRRKVKVYIIEMPSDPLESYAWLQRMRGKER